LHLKTYTLEKAEIALNNYLPHKVCLK